MEGGGTSWLSGRCTGHVQSGEWWPEMPPGQQCRKAETGLRRAPQHCTPTPSSRGSEAGLGPRSSHQDRLAVQTRSARGRRWGRGVATLGSLVVGKCDSCKASRPTRQQSPAGRGIRAAHCGARAASRGSGTAPWGPAPPPQPPNTCSLGHLQSCPLPVPRGRSCPIWKSLTRLPRISESRRSLPMGPCPCGKWGANAPLQLLGN